jgi:hypothetical protein
MKDRRARVQEQIGHLTFLLRDNEREIARVSDALVVARNAAKPAPGLIEALEWDLGRYTAAHGTWTFRIEEFEEELRRL